jgi:hypothetical protein
MTQCFPNFSGAQTTWNILVLRETKTIGFIVIGGPIELISWTKSGPRSKLWESLL